MNRFPPLPLFLIILSFLGVHQIEVQATSLASTASFESMQQGSDLIVIATVVKQSTRGTSAKPETHTLLKVSKYLKGSGKARLVLRQLGEATALGRHKIKDDAQLVPGQRVMLYLRSSNDSQFVHLTLLGYSAYDLIETKVKGTVLARPHHKGLNNTKVNMVTLGSETTLLSLKAKLAVGATR